MELLQVNSVKLINDDSATFTPAIKTVIMNERNCATGVAVNYGFTYDGGEVYAQWSNFQGQPYNSWQKIVLDESMKSLYFHYTNWTE